MTTFELLYSSFGSLAEEIQEKPQTKRFKWTLKLKQFGGPIRNSSIKSGVLGNGSNLKNLPPLSL